MPIRFTKLRDGKPFYSEIDDKEDTKAIIKSCFAACIPVVKMRVRWFLEDARRRQLTVKFKDYKVKLEKI